MSVYGFRFCQSNNSQRNKYVYKCIAEKTLYIAICTHYKVFKSLLDQSLMIPCPNNDSNMMILMIFNASFIIADLNVASKPDSAAYDQNSLRCSYKNRLGK